MKSLRGIIIAVTLLGLYGNCFSQQFSLAAAVCDNEDFENSASGAVTVSTGVQGWLVYRLSYMQPFSSNCESLTSPFTSTSSPANSEVLSAPGGYIDTLIGNSYPIYSVFGSGTANSGGLYNPEFPDMKGEKFLRLNRGSSSANQYEVLQKTINVTQSNALLRLAYLPVLQTGGACCQAPSLQIKFYASSSSTVPLACPAYSIAIPQNTFTVCSDTTGTAALTSTYFPGYYHKWRILAADLSPYIGTDIICRIGAFYCGNSGCPKFSYAYIDAQCSPMEIFVNGVPFPAHTNSVTVKNCGVASATVVAPPDFSAYQWNGPAGFSSTLSTISTSVAGVYTLDIIAAGTCSTITKYVNIQMFPLPTVSIVNSPTLICRNTQQQATITASGISTYTWNVPGNSATITVSPLNNTTYSVSGVDTNGCPGSASLVQFVVICPGIHSFAGNNVISVYPNPVNHEFIIQLTGTKNAGLVLKNALGASVLRQELVDGENLVPVQHLPKGIYSYIITVNAEQQYTGKILLE